MRKRLDVVDQRRAAEVARPARERWPEGSASRGGPPSTRAWPSPPRRCRRPRRRRARGTVHSAGRPSGVRRSPARAVRGVRVLLAQVDVTLRRVRDRIAITFPPASGAAGAPDVTVLDRAGLALVCVHDDVPRPGLAEDGLPLAPGREARSSVADEAGGLELLDDALRRRQRTERASPPRRSSSASVRPSVPSPSAGPSFVGASPPCAARSCRLASAPARGRSARGTGPRARIRVGLRREQVARPEAVADGPGADADCIDRYLQERVEGDDLVHLATPNVHVVGERVRELRRDRADLAPDTAEVVQEPCPLPAEALEGAIASRSTSTAGESIPRLGGLRKRLFVRRAAALPPRGASLPRALGPRFAFGNASTR